MNLKDAYDVKSLGQKLVDAGVPMGEVAAMKICTVILDWVKESASKSTEGMIGVADDFVAQGVEPLKLVLNKLLDLNKDGQIG